MYIIFVLNTYLSICIQMPFQFPKLSVFKKNQYGALHQECISIEGKTEGRFFFLVERRTLHNVLIIVRITGVIFFFCYHVRCFSFGC